ncbi:hypothetical protein ACSVDA_01735 [Cytobacillus sp. Hm23]|uniref:hypothetical protein n=1 Tax=Cytobacillus sp. IB215665 TaxID=3097357 RepID=UPI002A157F89|nr:hypothetical protein [Cytobacillus sp. IB215665]MDX8364446.1 hypothetical protein [Cytobacillus sp. IB215665]
MFRLFLFLVGFGLCVAGGISIIAYLNLLTLGVGVMDYVIFISKRVESYLLVIGICIIWLSIYLQFDNEE